MRRNRIFCTVILVLAICLSASAADSYELVLSGGRVMDPASGLDARRNIGIIGDKIAAISERPLVGKTVVNIDGLVVAPGFIDLHQHGFKPSDLALKVQDGVTTALELEIGVYPVGTWYKSMRGNSPVNYGATVSHPGARFAAFRPDVVLSPETRITAVVGTFGKAGAKEVYAMTDALRKGIAEGALGVGFGINYTPAADTAEIEQMFRVAGDSTLPVFVHTRAFGIRAIREVIGAAEKTGASIHIVHIGSSALNDMTETLQLIDSMKRRGMDVTAEVYPYTAASTRIESAMFNDGWQNNLRIDYADVAWAATGERLTEATFTKYRQQGGWVIMHMMKEENVRRALAHPGVMVASDSVPFVDGTGHPRGAGTFCRVLGHYVRDEKVLPLMDALAKMTSLPAQRLQHVPAMRLKGKISVGADADITVFNAQTIGDRATFEKPATPSVGIVHVLVNGSFVLRDGDLVGNAFPGRSIRLDGGRNTKNN